MWFSHTVLWSDSLQHQLYGVYRIAFMQIHCLGIARQHNYYTYYTVVALFFKRVYSDYSCYMQLVYRALALSNIVTPTQQIYRHIAIGGFIEL